MAFLIKRNGYYFYNRRVPEALKEYFNKECIRVSLKTDSKQIAVQRSAMLNQDVENYWKSLVERGKQFSSEEFKDIVKLSRILGFQYSPVSELAIKAYTQELLERISTAEKNLPIKDGVEAILGSGESPQTKISDALEKFWGYAKDRSMNKSEDQIRKWKNPRIKAIGNFIKVVGDKFLNDLNREDILVFRDWWISRIEDENLNESTANKDFIHLKNIIQTVNDNMGLGLDVIFMFQRINLKEKFSQNRKPFETEFIQNEILNPDNLKDLNEEARFFLYAMADTGARLKELTGLEADDIVLDHPIPHIKIRNKKNRELKTPHSERDIPLVGCALYAFKNCPEGFARYRDRTDTLSNLLNKYLRNKGLLPTEQHSVYSLRHSFQDRLLSVNAPDRVQADINGHKFNRPLYGEGASLEHKQDWLLKICFQPPKSNAIN